MVYKQAPFSKRYRCERQWLRGVSSSSIYKKGRQSGQNVWPLLIMTALRRVVYPIMIRSLIPSIGFKYTSLSVALVILLTLGVSNIVLHQPTAPKAKRAFLEKSALKDAPYILFVFGCMLSFLGIYTTFFYLASYAVQEGITTESTASYFVPSECHSIFFINRSFYFPTESRNVLLQKPKQFTNTCLVLNGASVSNLRIQDEPLLKETSLFLFVLYLRNSSGCNF